MNKLYLLVKRFKFSFAAFIITVFLIACHSEKEEYWCLNNLEEIGGHPVSIIGNPEVVETEIGKAIKFDGDGDQLLVDFNPLGNTKEFTVEVVFKAAACFPENAKPRFIHFQDPNDSIAKRLMIELRLNEKNECYLDAFLRTDTGSLVLIDENLVHPTETWLHAAVTYKNHRLTSYINGEIQLSGEIGYKEAFINPAGKVAIGGRMNQENWYRGLIKTLKISKIALKPEEFIFIND
jgi:hypothetical protein